MSRPAAAPRARGAPGGRAYTDAVAPAPAVVVEGSEMLRQLLSGRAGQSPVAELTAHHDDRRTIAQPIERDRGAVARSYFSHKTSSHPSGNSTTQSRDTDNLRSPAHNNRRCVADGVSITPAVSSWMCSLPRCSNIRVPLPKSTGTKWIEILSTNPVLMYCCPMSAPLITVTSLSPATAFA